MVREYSMSVSMNSEPISELECTAINYLVSFTEKLKGRCPKPVAPDAVHVVMADYSVERITIKVLGSLLLCKINLLMFIVVNRQTAL